VSPAAPWAELVTLAEREHELARDGRWDEVAETSAQRLRAAQALGAPPADARPHLERLAELQAQITATVASARAFTLRKIGSMERGRTAVRGYGTAGRSAAPARLLGHG
jgi:hypothetical protein